jgi:hypothetical protein
MGRNSAGRGVVKMRSWLVRLAVGPPNITLDSIAGRLGVVSAAVSKTHDRTVYLVDLKRYECHDKRQQSGFFPMFIDGNFIKSFVSRPDKEDVP